MSKSAVAGTRIQHSVNPQWLNLFTSNYATYCPVMHFRLLTTAGAALSDARFNLVNPDSPTTSRIDILNDASYTFSFRLQGLTMAKNNYITLTARVCGAETVSVVSSPAKFFINGWAAGTPSSLPEADRYIVVLQSTF